MRKFIATLFILLATATTAVALNVDTTDKYAWGENIGWLNWSTTEGDIDITDAVGMDGYIWGENVGWINLDPVVGAVEYGVTASGSEWTGYAWGENIGWISFSCENTSSCGTVDYAVRSSGSEELTGYAWGENVGWVNMNCDNDASCGTVEFGVRYTPPTPTPTPTPGGGSTGYFVSPTPTPSVPTSPVTSPTSVPTTVVSPQPSAFPTPTSPPPTVTPTSSPPVTPPPSEIVDRITEWVDRFSSTVFGVCDGPLGTAACGVTALSSLSVLLALLGLLIQSEWIATGYSLLQIIGLRRRAKVWGVVYDSHSKHPIPLVKLELLDEANRVLETRYADRDGRYGFLTSPASLQEPVLRVHIRVSKPGFVFPSSMTTTGTDYVVYEHLYRGGVIELRGDALINFNIPMDPTLKTRISWSGLGQGIIGTMGDRILSLGFYAGLVLVPLNWWFAPTAKNFWIGVVFVVANAIRLLALYRPYGVTKDSLTGHTMPFSLVVLNDLEGNRQGFSVSDEYGRFILSGQADKDYEVIAYTPANVVPQRSVIRRVRGIRRFSTQAWITETLSV